MRRLSASERLVLGRPTLFGGGGSLFLNQCPQTLLTVRAPKFHLLRYDLGADVIGSCSNGIIDLGSSQFQNSIFLLPLPIPYENN